MSHQIMFLDYHCSKSEHAILKELDSFAYGPKERSSYHGNLKFHREPVYRNYEEAKAAIEKMDKGWYDDHAVMYKEGRKKFWLVKVEYHT